jgi:HAMP domain-containing protein
MSEKMTPEVKKAIELARTWDFDPLPDFVDDLADYAKSALKEIDDLKAEVERLRDEWREKRYEMRREIDQFERHEFDHASHEIVFGVELAGELNDEVLKRIYGKYWL